MKSDSGLTTSVWEETSDVPQGPALGEDKQTDVCIIGAGIAGLSTAYMLTQEGRSVIVLDDGPIAGGETSHTTAHLSNAIDDRYFEIERLHGEQGARIVATSHTTAIDLIETIISDEQIACDFERVDGYLFVPAGESAEVLARELKAAHRAGLTEVERLDRAQVTGFDTGPCLRFPRQGQFHILKYLDGLVRAIKRQGGQIFNGTHATSIEGGEAARVETEQGNVVTCGAVVVATNSPVNDRVAIHTKQAPYRTFVIGARVGRGSVTHALYWDTLDPYHYIRLQPGETPDYDILIIGGEDHKTGQADDGSDRHARLEAWARERFSSIEQVEFRWSGQVMETVDGVAYIGRNPMDADNVYIATGDSGMGMTHGTIAGRLLTDLIVGRECSWASLYDPSRVTLSAAGEFTKENINVAAQYTDLLTPGDVSSVDEIRPGTGAVIRRGLTKLAVYRDEQGTLHERSAICVHLGCVVAWNSLEKSWDCPCHGSRYDCYGNVVNGPANKGLDLVED